MTPRRPADSGQVADWEGEPVRVADMLDRAADRFNSLVSLDLAGRHTHPALLARAHELARVRQVAGKALADSQGARYVMEGAQARVRVAATEAIGAGGEPDLEASGEVIRQARADMESLDAIRDGALAALATAADHMVATLRDPQVIAEQRAYVTERLPATLERLQALAEQLMAEAGEYLLLVGTANLAATQLPEGGRVTWRSSPSGQAMSELLGNLVGALAGMRAELAELEPEPEPPAVEVAEHDLAG